MSPTYPLADPPTPDDLAALVIDEAEDNEQTFETPEFGSSNPDDLIARLTRAKQEALAAREARRRAAAQDDFAPAPRPADLAEIAFQIYDRQAQGYRTLRRALTQRARVKLAKQLLDSLTGVTSALDLDVARDDAANGMPLPSPSQQRSWSAAFTCSQNGQLHDPADSRFIYQLSQCLSHHEDNVSDDPEALLEFYQEHGPWYMRCGIYGSPTALIPFPDMSAVSESEQRAARNDWTIVVPFGVSLPPQTY